MIPIDVPGTFNVRDAACGPVEPGRLYRSAMLDELEQAGVDALVARGVRTVIDLRDDSEKPETGGVRPWQVVDVPLYDPETGPPTCGDLDSVYRSLLSRRGHQLTDAVRAVAHAPGPVLVHCAVGKDRTGLVIALALAATGTADAAILADYALSGEQIRPYREPHVLRLLAGRQLDEETRRASLELHLDSPSAALERALGWIRDGFGSVPEYLTRHGFTDADFAALQRFLCGSPRLTVLHLSDVHATTDGALYHRVDGTERLRHVTDAVAASTLRPDAVVLTGDLCQAGEFAVYPRLAEAVEDMRVRLGCPVLAVPGNHDHPELFTAAFGGTRVVDVRGYRLVGLDTGDGHLGDAELDRLRSVLAAPAPHGTVLAMHHPPIPAAAAALVGRELREPDRLASVLDGSDVRVILAGHFHHPMSGTLGTVPVWVGGSLAYLQDTGAAADTVVGLDAPSFSVLRLDGNGANCVPVPLTAPEVLFRRSPHTTTAVAAATA